MLLSLNARLIFVTVITGESSVILRGLKGKHKDGSEVIMRMDVIEIKHNGAPLLIAKINPIDKNRDAFIVVNKLG